MRIRFSAPSNETESSARRDLTRRIDAFHSHLGASLGPALASPSASPDEVARLEGALTEAAARIAEGLRVEIDPSAHGVCRVVIAPADLDGPALVAVEVVERAPPAPRIEIVRHRPPVDVLPALADVRARAGVDLSSARARLGFSRGHLLEVVLYAPSFASAADESALDGANLLLSRLIGDELFDAWVGAVDVAPLPRGGSLRVLSDGATPPEETLPLGEVLPAVEAAIRGVRAELPEAPYHVFCERAEWTLLELEPTFEEDYAAQDDLALVSTMVPEAAKCFLQGSPFASSRFSNHGERFAYVKVDTAESTVDGRHELSVALEEALNVALVPGRLGCVVGTGIGTRYVYLNLALEDLEQGVRVTRERLQALGTTRRAWVLFCDSGWMDEWAGIWDDSPPPPSPFV
jgi:hypothetical protein